MQLYQLYQLYLVQVFSFEFWLIFRVYFLKTTSKQLLLLLFTLAKILQLPFNSYHRNSTLNCAIQEIVWNCRWKYLIKNNIILVEFALWVIEGKQVNSCWNREFCALRKRQISLLDCFTYIFKLCYFSVPEISSCVKINEEKRSTA